ALAAGILPFTPLVDGRPGKPRSHWWYWVTGVPPQYTSTGCQVEGGPCIRPFTGPDDKELLKLIGTGGQANVPPTLWTGKDGRTERGEWRGDGAPWDLVDPATVDCTELYLAAEQLATACGWTLRPRKSGGGAAAMPHGFDPEDLEQFEHVI